MTKTILMIHGVGCGGDAWDDIKPLFEQAGWTCSAPTLFPDQRTLDNPPDTLPNLRFDDYIEETSRWAREITAQTGKRPVVMGHSMGGLLAQKLAERGDIAAGVLVTPAQPEDCNVRDVRVFRTFWNIIKHGLKKSATMPHKVGRNGLAYGVWNCVPKARHDELYKGARFDSGGVYKDLLDGIPLDEQKIDVPMLTICAAKDRATVPKAVRKLRDKLKRAPVPGDYLEYPNHAHWIIGEPGFESVAADILSWLETSVTQEGNTV